MINLIKCIDVNYHSIHKEITYEDVVKYCELYEIKKSNIKKLYEFYLTQYNSKGIPQYEWLFKEQASIKQLPKMQKL